MRFAKYVGLVALLVVLVLNATGFCWKQLRYLSDEELIVTAILYTAGSSGAKDVASTEEQAEAYYRSNPDCCSFIAWNDQLQSSPLINRLIGRAVFGIEVVLPVSESADGGTHYNSFQFIGCCGKRLRGIGIAL